MWQSRLTCNCSSLPGQCNFWNSRNRGDMRQSLKAVKIRPSLLKFNKLTSSRLLSKYLLLQPLSGSSHLNAMVRLLMQFAHAVCLLNVAERGYCPAASLNLDKSLFPENFWVKGRFPEGPHVA